MSDITYEKFLADLVKPLVTYPEEVVIKTFAENDESVTLQVMVNSKDLGRIIGKKGRIANSIRTIIYAFGAKKGKKVEVEIDSF